MIEVGRLCVKVAGRDSNKKCLVIDTIDDNYVLIDGETRRKKCNIDHLEPLDTVVKISKGAAHSAVVDELKKLGIKISEKPKKVDEKKKEP